MFVCLKNIFATDDLDTILLREYAELPEGLQDIYRHVAAIEAAGARVHRQLILKILHVNASEIAGLLAPLAGLVDEHDVDSANGIYTWSTRHLVIARTIARYKYIDAAELFALFERIIEHLNPTNFLELRTLRDICSREFGIGRIQHPDREVTLYRMLSKLAPSERIPHHRIVSTLLDKGDLLGTAEAIRAAERDVGRDSVIQRFKVRLGIRRALETTGIREEDRRAIFGDTVKIALEGIRRDPKDKHAYIAYADLGYEIASRYKDASRLDDAIQRMQQATAEILDPQLDEALEANRRRSARFK
jgi:hypothetical protein